MVIGAVLLINKDRIANIVHYDILKVHFGSSSRSRGSRPGFHPHAIHRVGKRAVPNHDTDDRFFVRVPAKAAHADAMSRPTVHSLNIYVPATITNRDTVISGLYVRVGYINPVRTSNVDSIGVDASFCSRNGEVLEAQVLASQNIDMEVFTVQGSYVPDHRIGDEIEP